MTEPQTLMLSGDCGLRAARCLIQKIAAALRETSQLTIDCSDVHSIDVSFVQLILAAEKTAGREGRHLRLVRLSELGQSTFRRAGVELPGISNLHS